MSVIDALEVLSDYQEVKGTEYSKYGKHVGAPNDWGLGGMPRFITVISHGDFTLGASLEIQLIGYTDNKNMSDAFVICTTGSIQQADIHEGSKWDLVPHRVGKKYSHFCLKYVVPDVGENPDPDDTLELCPTKPVLNDEGPKENTFSAFTQFATDSQMEYPYANQDYTTA